MTFAIKRLDLERRRQIGFGLSVHLDLFVERSTLLQAACAGLRRTSADLQRIA